MLLHCTLHVVISITDESGACQRMELQDQTLGMNGNEQLIHPKQKVLLHPP